VWKLISHTNGRTYMEGYENRVLRVFGPKMKEVERGWRRLQNEELHKL
jgi:hypothetical protein